MSDKSTTVYLTKESKAYINWKIYAEKSKGDSVTIKGIMNKAIAAMAMEDSEYPGYLKNEK